MRNVEETVNVRKTRHLNDLQLPSKVQIIQEAMIITHPRELAFDLATIKSQKNEACGNN